MTNTKLKITGISHPRCIKTGVEVLTTPESIQHTKVKPRKVESLSLSFIGSILIAFFSIVGCSDMPYTGSMMTTDTVDVNQYIVSPNEELVCLQNGHDSECLTLIPKNTEKVDSIINGPIIHIHPERLVYVFYHEGEKIVQAEKVMDTTELVETLTETKEDPSRQTDDLVDDTGPVDDDPADDNSPDDTQQPAPLQQQPITQQPVIQQPVIQQPVIQQPVIQQPVIQQPPQTTYQPGGTGTVGDAPNANNNPDDTQQPITPPPPPPPPQQRTVDPPGGTDTVGDAPNANNNPDDTQQPDPPSQRNNDPPNDNTPPPPPQTTNQPRGNSNQNVGSSNQNAGGDNAPDPTVLHPKPNAMYYNDLGGWGVTIYYPENYVGSRTQSDYGFSISSSNGIAPVLQGSINSNSGSARFHITAGNGTLYVNVVWNTESTRWKGDPPSERYLLQAGSRGSHRIMINIR